MRFSGCFLVLALFIAIGCNSANSGTPAQERVALSYDSIEIKYEKLSQVAYDLIDNVSTDEKIQTSRLEELLENIPTVTFDFKNVPGTRVDIRIFIQHQASIESEINKVFTQLDSSESWKNAPIVSELKQRYQQSVQEVAAARKTYDEAVDQAKLDMKIVPDKSSKTARKN